MPIDTERLQAIIESQDFFALCQFIIDAKIPRLSRSVRDAIIRAEIGGFPTCSSFYKELASYLAKNRDIHVTPQVIKHLSSKNGDS